ncbi:phenylalanyl-tRNA synthetase alpha chain [Methylacidimicrobium cyclopophantes]|uniref:Phenylalanine--tRNA ligase alpha subunit n=1 Tax=Methylacidimicrobium cyclopophantes TaxID=1041766 RepID=A0A5E6MG76_9BACT|nr:phenylalanine--tRNA ligase subunit alpha [Methylacidimicrobium cyclopophantes]VVM08479.1 phenylalanyl-tRNA synthetase alpha chain [Methylacidimicrobium cyclopophantes]
MEKEIQDRESELQAALAATKTESALEEIRIRYFGRKGIIPALLASVSTLPPERRREVGRAINAFKDRAEAAIREKRAALTPASVQSASLDTTLPGRPVAEGSLHPISRMSRQIVEIFRRLGFALADGPEVETEFYNFDALNTPPDHPARNEQDTFFLRDSSLLLADPSPKGGRLLLRSQTSPVQIRVMERQRPPIRIVAPGRCYRRDEIDATHSIAFFQVEGLVVDEDVSLRDLKGTLELVFRELLGHDTRFRFRPHYFPFTEPSFEIDGFRPGRSQAGKDWLELCGCGMVHPKVLTGVGIDPDRYSGFAFGFGIERLLMIVGEVPDLRFFTENDVRFLRNLSSPI